MEYLATISDGIASVSNLTTVGGSVTISGGSTFTPGPPITTTFNFGDGYWMDGFWYPYCPHPVGYPVPYPVAVPAFTREPTPRELAVEILKMGPKAPKVLRDKAAKILSAALGG